METCNYLLYLALILMCTKFLGLLTRRARMPQVVGALLAGLLLGPAVFKIIPQTEFLTQTAEVGVVILMFCARHGNRCKGIKKMWKSSDDYRRDWCVGSIGRRLCYCMVL